MKTKVFEKIIENNTTKKVYAEAFENAAIGLRIGISTQERMGLKESAQELIALSSLLAKYFCEDVDLLTNANYVLVEKAKEYAMCGDRLWNFKCNYQFMHNDPCETLWGYLTKHLVSCMDILTDKIKPTKLLITEKFGDVVNYCLLIIALTEEKE